MNFHPILLVLHILSAVVWLSMLPVDIVLRQSIAKASAKGSEKELISLYFKFADWTGRIGGIGILLTGILMIIILPYYGFFDFSANHWLATKQVITVIIIIVGGAVIAPTTKKIKVELESDSPLSENFYRNYRKLSSTISLLSVLVLINFLLAITHRFIG